jgi:hypothetical protein
LWSSAPATDLHDGGMMHRRKAPAPKAVKNWRDAQLGVGEAWLQDSRWFSRAQAPSRRFVQCQFSGPGYGAWGEHRPAPMLRHRREQSVPVILKPRAPAHRRAPALHSPPSSSTTGMHVKTQHAARSVEVPVVARSQLAPAPPVSLSRHSATPLLDALDDRLEEALSSGAIKLVRAAYLCDARLQRIERRQQLEQLERRAAHGDDCPAGARHHRTLHDDASHDGPRTSIFLPPDEAVASLRSRSRSIGVLT